MMAKEHKNAQEIQVFEHLSELIEKSVSRKTSANTLLGDMWNS